MSVKPSRKDLIGWGGLLKEFEPKLHSGNPQTLLSEIDTLLRDKGYATLPESSVQMSELSSNFRSCTAGITASRTGAVSTAKGLKALGAVGVIIAVIGGILLPFYSTTAIGLVLLFIGVALAVVGFAVKPKAPVGAIGAAMAGFVYPTVLKEKEEVTYISFELRITVGAVTTDVSTEIKDAKKADPTKEDFNAVCELIKNFLK